MNTGKRFEQLTAEILNCISGLEKNDAHIEKDVKIQSADGLRQVDMVVKGMIGGFEFTTFVECKDHKRPIDVSHLDKFHSLLTDCGANKGIMVSSSGFSKAARSKALRYNIATMTLENEEQLRQNGRDFRQLSVAVHVIEKMSCTPRYVFVSDNPKLTAKLEDSVSIESLMVPNGINMRLRFIHAMLKGELPVETTGKSLFWPPLDISSGGWVLNRSNQRVYFSDMHAIYWLYNVEHYFGPISSLPSYVLVTTQDTNGVRVVPTFNIDDFLELKTIRTSLARFQRLAEIENYESASHRVLIHPSDDEQNYEVSNMSLIPDLMERIGLDRNSGSLENPLRKGR